MDNKGTVVVGGSKSSRHANARTHAAPKAIDYGRIDVWVTLIFVMGVALFGVIFFDGQGGLDHHNSFFLKLYIGVILTISLVAYRLKHSWVIRSERALLIFGLALFYGMAICMITGIDITTLRSGTQPGDIKNVAMDHCHRRILWPFFPDQPDPHTYKSERWISGTWMFWIREVVAWPILILMFSDYSGSFPIRTLVSTIGLMCLLLYPTMSSLIPCATTYEYIARICIFFATFARSETLRRTSSLLDEIVRDGWMLISPVFTLVVGLEVIAYWLLVIGKAFSVSIGEATYLVDPCGTIPNNTASTGHEIDIVMQQQQQQQQLQQQQQQGPQDAQMAVQCAPQPREIFIMPPPPNVPTSHGRGGGGSVHQDPFGNAVRQILFPANNRSKLPVVKES